MKQFITYYRVSTKDQATHGHSISGQRDRVNTFCCDGEIISKYTEQESGTNNLRPEFNKALKQCKLTGATLVVASLDRLSRNSHFISTLMQSGVNFIACDMPDANKLTIHLMAAIAEHEADCISNRTKNGLKAARSKGIKLGASNESYQETRRLNKSSGKPSRTTAHTQYSAVPGELVYQISQLRQDGLTLKAIANRLNEQGYLTPTGKPFKANRISDCLARLERAA